MKSLSTAMITLAIFFTTPALAGTQQEKMVSCNADASAKALKGDERKAFMKNCLSAEKEVGNSQQLKMKTCNEEAGKKALKGDDRKTFMKSCLSGIQ